MDSGSIAINPDHIKQVRSRPETTVVMVDGAEYSVTQTVDEIVRMVADSRALVLGLALGVMPQNSAAGPKRSTPRVWNIDDPAEGRWGTAAEIADALSEVESWANR